MNFRRYSIELASALIFYAGLLSASNLIEKNYHPTGNVLITLALLPMLGCVAALWAIMRAFRQLDELQLRVQFEALAFAFAVTALISFSYGFLEGIGFPKLSMFNVWPLMAVSWMLGIIVAKQHYR